MKLTIEPGALAGAVRFAARTLTARTAYPILSGLKITADPDAEVSEPGTVLAAGRLLAEICARLPRQPAGLTDDGTALTLTCGSTRYRLHLLPMDTYPTLPELAAPAGRADPGEFAAAVRQVVIAASRDDTLPALAAVQLTFADDAVTMVATDRYRAALRRLPWRAVGGPLPSPVLIPAPALAEAARTAADDRVALHVLTGDDGEHAVAGFGDGDHVITTRLTAGEYPDVARLIPAGFRVTVTADAAELAEAIKRLAVVAARESPVRLAIGPGQIELTADSGDEADGTDAIACELDGDPMAVAFLPQRLLDAFTAADAARVRIALNGPDKAALVTPADDGQDDDGPACRHLLMPLRPAG
jgi:DNA polymerase III subunit beta